MTPDLYADYEVLPAPNRYRKVFRKMAGSGAECSEGMLLFALEGVDGWQDALRTVDEMQRADWPEKADRFVGIEPHLCLHDMILIWSKEPGQA